jgi:hypothetical protein
MLQSDEIDGRKAQLEMYLNNLLLCPKYRNYHETVRTPRNSLFLAKPKK